ncbi:MAG: hypothetical protein RJP95_03475, partial [Pirellulales bacterium]
RKIRDDHKDAESGLKGWQRQPLSLKPWAIWTLFGLVRHCGQQQFVDHVVATLRTAAQTNIPTMGAVEYQGIPPKGIVRGFQDWEYYFHGKGCCLTRRSTGEPIEVNFDSTDNWFDQFGYIIYLKSLHTPTFAEDQIIQLHPSFDTVRQSMRDLEEAGLLVQHPDNPGTMGLTFAPLELWQILYDIEADWHIESTKLKVASAVGDWFLLNSMDLGSLNEQISRRMDECRDKRAEKMAAQFRSGFEPAESVQALADMNSPMLMNVLKQALQEKTSGATAVSLDIITELGDARWCDDLLRLKDHTDPYGEAPRRYIWHQCVQFLLRHGRSSGIKQELQSDPSPDVSRASILALEYFPDIAIELFRRALRSDAMHHRCIAAAALAIIDQPWSRAELTAVLQESGDWVFTAECRAALSTVHSQECQQIVLDWEHSHRRRPGDPPLNRVDELKIETSVNRINFEMGRLHDRVLRLRNTTP